MSSLNALSDVVHGIKLIAFDFDGVFTDNTVYISQEGIETVRCWRGDGIGLSKLRRRGLDLIVISTETNPVISIRCKKLNLPCLQGVEDKRAALNEVISEKGLTFDQVAFVGNDINDAACLDVVGLPIVVKDAHEDVLQYALYHTDRPGGYGAVREICDMFDAILARS
jgi:3-deoxy-D-manno-octulosonate 8-phosphate phosphatase (KDO 8-P phosphatase)